MPSNRELFYQYLGQTSEFPLALEIERAQGVYMYEETGKKYIDLISGIGVSALGHSHPKVLKAIHEQVDQYLHLMVYGEFVESPQVQLAKKLTSTLPDTLQNVFLVNSGSEATEGAIKLAKRYTGRSEIISCLDAYHGSTHGALSVSGNEHLKTAYRPLLPHVRHIPYNDELALSSISGKTAAVIVETVQGEAGVRVPDKNYLSTLRQVCSANGALLILDEIQCGMGRTGTLWAFEQHDIVPDILLTAKGLGGGMPIGAFISSKEIMHKLTHAPILGHITTFGGHPVSAAAALATLETIIEGDILDKVEEKSQLIKDLLVHPKIKEVRGAGLMLAAEFESFDVLKAIIDQLLHEGVLTDWFLFCDNALRIAPPLIISHDEIKMACKKILQAIDIVCH